jgi:hypothetical protein
MKLSSHETGNSAQLVIPAQAGIQRLLSRKTLGPRRSLHPSALVGGGDDERLGC